MAGIVIIGAQWGDEGKGKITDLIAENADLVIRFQGGNNAGHTIVRDGREVEVPPDPVRDPLPGQALRDRQRRRDRPEGPHGRARRPAREGHRPLRPADQRQRAPDHAVPHAPRPRGGDEARQAPDRHHAARHRPRVRRQGRAARHPRPGPARREDPQEEDHGRDGAQAPRAAPLRQVARARPAVDDRGLPHLRPPDRAVHRRHRADHLEGARRRPRRHLRGRPGHAARHRPRHVSLRDVVEPRGRERRDRHRRRAEGPRRDLGRGQGVRDPRRRRPVPDGARRRARRRDPRGRRRVRHHHRAARAASAGSTSSPCATPRGSTRSRTSRSRSSTC